jgi:DNA (cytosine-5)-methyltransferase 1
MATPGKYHDLIPQTRQALIASGLPYIIENVPGAPLIDPVILCGTMFGLQTEPDEFGHVAELRRHRLFETNWPFVCDLHCDHNGNSISVTGTGNAVGRTISVHGDHARDESVRWRQRKTICITGHTPQYQQIRSAKRRAITVTGSTAQTNTIRNELRESFPVEQARIAMGMTYVGWDGKRLGMNHLSQAVPPAYTAYIGRKLMKMVKK